MPEHPAMILIIDDEESIRDSCSQILIKEGYRVEAAPDGTSGLQKVRDLHPAMVLVDLKMPGMNGMEVLERLKDIDPSIISLVITGYGTVDSAVEAMKKGAYDFISKPFSPDELRIIIKRGLERRKLILEAESLRKEKKLIEENFITMVSHQMRSPIAAVQQYFEVILAGLVGQVEEKQREMIQRARNRLDNLMNLINDWLDMAKMDKGLIVHRLKPLPLKGLLKKLVEFMQPLADENRVTLEMDAASEARSVQGDEETLEQVFINLISNAIKYNRSEGVVKISIKKQDGFVATEIQDSGIGIAREHLPLIFEQFYRVDRKENQKTKGTGLGLSIAKKIVDAHGGMIHVSSELGKGSTFMVLLPEAK